MAEIRPGTEMISLENAGILLMDDKPAEVDRAIDAFVKRAKAPSAAASTRSPK